MTYEILRGDCIAVMRTMPDCSVDSIVTDPPYELGFMGKSWDASGIAYSVDMWAEALRVLKPGGHLLAFSGSRTYHRMTCAIEDAGFEVRDQIMWVYGSGFPKSLDVSKAIDKSRAGHAFDEIRDYLRGAIKSAAMSQVAIKKHLGYPADSGVVSHWVANSQPTVPRWKDWCAMKAILPLDDRYDALIESADREKVGEKRSGIADGNGPRHTIGAASSVVVDITAPATDAARQWGGWGTALKPAHEPICVARKPLVGTVAANVLAHGTGALNIDGCRVSADDGENRARPPRTPDAILGGGKGTNLTASEHNDLGRWPANLIHDGSEEVVALFPAQAGAAAPVKGTEASAASTGNVTGERARVPGAFHGDSGSAARFFYCAKASKSDRGPGNTHPTVKPLALMRYLLRLVTPPGGHALDPFAGSGSTIVAGLQEGFRMTGIELIDEHADIADRRAEDELVGGDYLMDNAKRLVGHFSCGAASAVAIKLAIEENRVAAQPLPVEIIYCHVREEDTDNVRFMRDCQEWFGHPIQVLENARYGGSIVNVMRERRFINSAKGAPCTLHLKKEPAREFARDGDLNVYGYTAGEEDRLDGWIDANNGRLISAPLIDRGLDKGAVLALVERAGIALPRLYAMGYDHNNCIGCVKGGAWYWNKIRVDFPERFAQQMAIEEAIGHPTLRVNKQAVWLRELAPNRGRRHEEPAIQCGVTCEAAEATIISGGIL